MLLTSIVIAEHPRARGENNLNNDVFEPEIGTSPRTRGKPPAKTPSELCIRNIPAHAGKTVGPGLPSCLLRGTSPRTRGKPTTEIPPRTRRRNIPAHAGKTGSTCTADHAAEEHPRARGENTPTTVKQAFETGTSPRTRGKPLTCTFTSLSFRNIPAHAGKTLWEFT